MRNVKAFFLVSSLLLGLVFNCCTVQAETKAGHSESESEEAGDATTVKQQAKEKIVAAKVTARPLNDILGGWKPSMTTDQFNSLIDKTRGLSDDQKVTLQDAFRSVGPDNFVPVVAEALNAINPAPQPNGSTAPGGQPGPGGAQDPDLAKALDAIKAAKDKEKDGKAVDPTSQALLGKLLGRGDKDKEKDTGAQQNANQNTPSATGGTPTASGGDKDKAKKTHDSADKKKDDKNANNNNNNGNQNQNQNQNAQNNQNSKDDAQEEKKPSLADTSSLLDNISKSAKKATDPSKIKDLADSLPSLSGDDQAASPSRYKPYSGGKSLMQPVKGGFSSNQPGGFGGGGGNAGGGGAMGAPITKSGGGSDGGGGGFNLSSMRLEQDGGGYGGAPVFEKGGTFSADVVNAGALTPGDAVLDGSDTSDSYVVKHPSAAIQVTLGDANSPPGMILDKFAGGKLSKAVCASSRPGQFSYCFQHSLKGITGKDQGNFSSITGFSFENNI